MQSTLCGSDTLAARVLIGCFLDNETVVCLQDYLSHDDAELDISISESLAETNEYSEHDSLLGTSIPLLSVRLPPHSFSRRPSCGKGWQHVSFLAAVE